MHGCGAPRNYQSNQDEQNKKIKTESRTAKTGDLFTEPVAIGEKCHMASERILVHEGHRITRMLLKVAIFLQVAE